MDVQYSDPPMRIAARAALFFAPGEPLGVQEVMLAEPGPLDVVVRMPAAASPRDAPGPLGAARRVLRDPGRHRGDRARARGRDRSTNQPARPIGDRRPRRPEQLRTYLGGLPRQLTQ